MTYQQKQVAQMPVSIRPARVDDARTIAQFQIAMALETENKQLDPETVQPAVESVFDDPGKGFYVVAEMDARLAGSLMITFEWSDWRNSNMWYIQSVYVDKPVRGRGIFRQLYRHVIELAAQQNVMFVRLYVEVDNAPAQRIYESLGMKRMPYYMYDISVS